LQTIIENGFDEREQLSPRQVSSELKQAINEVVELLDAGKLRVAEKINQHWQVNEWLKKAVLLYFRINENQIIPGAFTKHFDKIPLKYCDHTPESFITEGARIVPPAIARKGAFIAANTVLMPSYVNIGAYIDTGSMIDT